MSVRRSIAALGLAALAPATLGIATSLPSATASTVAAPITLWAPPKVDAAVYGKRNAVYTDLGLRVIAQGAPFELRSTRASYDQPIQTVWKAPSGDVTLPAGTQKDFNGLPGFLDLTFTPAKKGTALHVTRSGCLANYTTERVSPDASATSDYPRSCTYNPYSLGSVQGIQDGWATALLTDYRPFKLAPGTYTVTAKIADKYATAFNLAPQDATRTITLTVTREDDGGGVIVDRPAHRAGSSSTRSPETRPTADRRGSVPGTVPDLRALPAWGIQMSPKGNFLQFSATVWNAGTSPLVVDGFRREGEDLMDGYQYFFDAEGNQTGYLKVGTFEWDPRPTHLHWHFQDFATYTLLDSTQTEIEKSKKEAFCLANTDAVDLTVPSAVWNVDNSDLSTACGDYSSLSTREVLASGWGDTYAQFRAGQAFDLRGLKNGTYYIKVAANPEGNLIESDTDNNVALRKIVIGGKPGARTVKVPQVGVIVEPAIVTGGR